MKLATSVLGCSMSVLVVGCGMSGGSSSSSPGPTTGPVAQPVTIDGDIAFMSDLEGHPHYHGAYYVQDPEFHFPMRNTSSQSVVVPYTIRIDGADIPGYGGTRHTVTIPAHGTVDDAAFQNPYDLSLNPSAGPRPSGEHEFTIVIDPDHMIGETNEGNNTYRAHLGVPTTNHVFTYAASDTRADLRFVDPHIHGPGGQTLRFHFVVKNFGHGPSQACHWQIRREGSLVMPDAVVSGASDLSIPMLAPDQEVTIVADVTDPATTGTFTYTLILDPLNESPNEVYEDNNSIDRFVIMGNSISN